MIVEIRKAGFINKGAQLMLYAAYEKLRAAYPEAIFTMTTTSKAGSQPFRKVVDLGFYPKARLHYMGLPLGQVASALPKKLREIYGIVLDREIDVVIDASGFSYSDQWGEKSSRELADSARRWRRHGTKVILMPQAFGPFRTRRIQKAIRRAVDNIDLVMPREKTSYNHLVKVVGEQPKIRQYPDFTNLISGVKPDYFDSNQFRACLVPNYRMIDKADGAQRSAYVPFMVKCAQQLQLQGAKPFILVHEGDDDHWLAEQISKGAGGLPVVVEDDPLKIKGILGACFVTIGSRFHGLVSALSQGVPSLGTGWSHKYIELFRDYGFPESLLSVDASEDVVARKIAHLVDEKTWGERAEALREISSRLESTSESMWNEVFSVIDQHSKSAGARVTQARK